MVLLIHVLPLQGLPAKKVSLLTPLFSKQQKMKLIMILISLRIRKHNQENKEIIMSTLKCNKKFLDILHKYRKKFYICN